MSNSTLYVVDEEYKGYVQEEYDNSWIFSPKVMDALTQKYLEEDELEDAYGRVSIFTHPEVFGKVKRAINRSNSTEDRILWYFVGQCIFRVEDKEEVSEAIKYFWYKNYKYFNNLKKNEIDRFEEIAEDILKVEGTHFIFKNTSIDDGVENMFEEYNEDEDRLEPTTLKESKEFMEFVVIDDGIEVYFKDKYFNKVLKT